MFTVELDDTVALIIAGEIKQLRHDLDVAQETGAQEGVEAAKESHPYTDRTHNLTNTSVQAESFSSGGGEKDAGMFWPMGYASFVDEGTSRNRPYPFTPLACVVAERGLEYHSEQAVQEFETRVAR